MPYADSSGVNIHYEVIGDGFPVMLHAGAGGNGATWKRAGYVTGLAGFRLILIDPRGHGRSDKPEGVEAHLVERYAGDALAVLDALALERAAFWGYSAGTWAGYSLAASHPHRIAGLVASGSIGADTDYCDPELRAGILAQADEALRGGRPPATEERGGVAIPEWINRQRAEMDVEVYAWQVRATAQWRGPWSLLPDIRVPVLMIVGEREDPERTTVRAAETMLDATCVTFPSLGHVGAYLRSDLALGHAVPFLRAWARR